MAIHPDLPGIEVTVCVDGQALKEYETENDPIKHKVQAIAAHQEKCTITKFVESADDTAFAVQLAVRAPYKMTSRRLKFEVEVDGVWVESPLMHVNKYNNTHHQWSRACEGPRSGNNANIIVNTMKFTKVETSEIIRPSLSPFADSSLFSG